MALSKGIWIEHDGREPVLKSYHRVNRVVIATNDFDQIEVSCYTSRERRESELAGGSADIEAMFFDAPYDQEMTVDSAYAYLKTLPEFEGAEDI